MVTFNDAQATAKAHPATFEAPSEDELAALKIGDKVLVCGDDRERFWCRVVKVDGDVLEATVSNSLVTVPLAFVYAVIQ